MSESHRKRIPSLVKKYLMALTGLVLVLFVLGHMLGNLQIFLGPEAINVYAYKLQTLPPPVLWGIRLFLLLCVAVHVWMAVLLTIENRQARPSRYAGQKMRETTFSSRVMPMTGLIILAFIIFHILHFTTQSIFPEYKDLHWNWDGKQIHDVSAMMIMGFSVWWISAFYILATGLLCSHLCHGFSSMFQSIGIRNEKWRRRLDGVAIAYGWIIFLGFAAIPVAVLAGVLQPHPELVSAAAEARGLLTQP